MPLLGWVPCALLVMASADADVAKGRELLSQLKYAEAAKALEAAKAQGGTDLETTLELYELYGVVQGTLKQPDKARAAFTVLLSLDPTRTLKGSWPPRVKTPFFEAKSQVESTGPFTLTAQAEQDGKRVTSITVKVGNDPLKLALKERLHWRSGS